MADIISTVEDYLFGNETQGMQNGTLYPTETLPPEACYEQLDQSTQAFWDTVIVMAAFTLVLMAIPFVFSCCCNTRPRCLARIFFFSGLIKLIVGSLLASTLMPVCPPVCGEGICSIHQYNPGPLYGCVFMLIGLLWFCKGCFLLRSARKQELEKEAGELTMTEEGKEGKEVPEVV